MKKILDQYVTLILETYKAHLLQGETNYIKAHQAYIATQKSYSNFKKSELYKSYGIEEAMQADNLESALQEYSEAFNNYMKSNTLADCYDNQKFIDYKNFIGFRLQDPAWLLCNVYELYKKSKADEVHRCILSNKINFDKVQADNFQPPPIIPLQKKLIKSSETDVSTESYDSDLHNNIDQQLDVVQHHNFKVDKALDNEYEAEQFCLYILSTFLIDRPHYGPLNDLLIDFAVKLMRPFDDNKHQHRMIALKCQELLKEINQLPTESFSASYSNAQIITWGLQNQGNTFNLRNSDLYYLFKDDKWNTLAIAYKLSDKEAISMDVITLSLLQNYSLESMGNAFARMKVKVNALHLNDSYYQQIPIDIIPSFGHLLQGMGIKLLELSHSNLYQMEDHWWQDFCIMLNKAKIQELKLSQNQMGAMSDSLWLNFCESIAFSGLKTIHIDDIGKSRQAMLQTYLIKNAPYPNTFFQESSKQSNIFSSLLNYEKDGGCTY